MTSETLKKSGEALKVLSETADECSPVAFACSFGAEDMVILDLIARSGLSIEIFTLDTGRLPEETFTLITEIGLRYAVSIRIFVPSQVSVESYVNQNGSNAFYDSIQLREECCHIRKVEPLKRALIGKNAWITGLRREQALSRQALEVKSWDQGNGLWKVNPLLDWSSSEVWAYINGRDIPYNKLHDRGFPSIGCAPCTRAVSPGEDLRAGRWWWEAADESKECGLHPAGAGPEVRKI